jgi:hypothetical protein
VRVPSARDTERAKLARQRAGAGGRSPRVRVPSARVTERAKLARQRAMGIVPFVKCNLANVPPL